MREREKVNHIIWREESTYCS